MTNTHVIENKTDAHKFYAAMIAGDFPVTVSVCKGRKRSTKQNRLQRLWMNEISDQLADTPESWRGYCKLTIGVPILKAASDAYTVQYDEILKPLPYHLKMALVMEPFDLAVTRRMTSKQKADYLDQIIRHFGEKGVVLSMPQGPDNWGQDKCTSDKQ